MLAVKSKPVVSQTKLLQSKSSCSMLVKPWGADQHVATHRAHDWRMLGSCTGGNVEPDRSCEPFRRQAAGHRFGRHRRNICLKLTRDIVADWLVIRRGPAPPEAIPGLLRICIAAETRAFEGRLHTRSPLPLPTHGHHTHQTQHQRNITWRQTESER